MSTITTSCSIINLYWHLLSWQLHDILDHLQLGIFGIAAILRIEEIPCNVFAESTGLFSLSYHYNSIINLYWHDNSII